MDVKNTTTHKLSFLDEKNPEYSLNNDEILNILTSKSSDLLAITDLEGRRLFVSESYNILFDNAFDLKGTNSFQEIHADDKHFVLSKFNEVINSGECQKLEYRIVTPEKEVKFIEANLTLIKNDNDEADKVLSVGRDVTKRKYTETLLSKKNDFLIKVIDSIKYPFYVIDVKDYSILMANSSANSNRNSATTKCYELNNKERPCHELGLKCPLQLLKTNIQEHIVGEHEGLDEHGEPVWIEHHGQPIYDKHGNLAQVIEYTVDITGRKLNEKEIVDYIDKLEYHQNSIEAKSKELSLLNEKLKISERIQKSLNLSKDKFFSIIAHDLRSPFYSLLGYTEYLNDNINDLERNELGELTFRLNNTAVRVYKLLENLLEWSRVQTGRMEFAPEFFNLNDLIKEVSLLFSENSESKEIDVEFLEDADVQIFADINMTNTVLRNFLSNAIKFTPKSGSIKISLAQDLDYAILRIEDTGVGISEENIKNLFSIDENISTKGTNNEEGTGLGLILSHEFVKRNGGNILVSSEVNVGTTFTITLPTKESGNFQYKLFKKQV